LYIFDTYDDNYNASFPYMFIVKSGSTFKLYKVNKALKRGIYNSENWIMRTVPESMIVYILETSTGGDTYTNNNTPYSASSSITATNAYTIVWANWDILDVTGALYYAKSPSYEKYNTLIAFTPPGGVQSQVIAYDNCSTTQTSADRAGSFSVSAKDATGSLISLYPINTDVFIKQGGKWFRGWVKDAPKSQFATIRTSEFSGVSYAGMTQRKIVNEIYIDKAIDYIVKALFAKYYPEIGRVTYVTACATVTSINLQDVTLWDAMEQLSERAGYNWTINQAYLNVPTLQLYFYNPATNTADVTISETENPYARGSAQFLDDTSKLVNRLIVKAQNVIVDDEQYNIRMVLEDGASQAAYGIYDGIYTPKATYIADVIALGQAYLDRYKNPLKNGKIKPLYGDWSIEQKVNIDIPTLDVDDVYTITGITLTSNGTLIDRALTLTQAPRDYADVVKKINDRLTSLENKLSDTITNFNPLFYYVFSNQAENFYYNYINATTYPGANVYCNDEVFLSLRTSVGEVLRKAYSELTYNAPNDVNYSFYIDAGEATGTITGMSLYSKGASLTLGTGTALTSQITNIIKTSATVLKIDWRIRQ